MSKRGDLFGWEKEDVTISPCAKCNNYLGQGACLAFVAIPFDILDGTSDHRQPYPGDNGIQFEPIAEST